MRRSPSGDPSSVAIRDCRPGEEEAALDAIAGVATRLGRDIDRSVWRWRLRNPAGARLRLITGPDGSLVGVAACSLQRMLLEGRELLFERSDELLVDARFSGGITSDLLDDGDRNECPVTWSMLDSETWRSVAAFGDRELVRGQLSLSVEIERLRPGAAPGVDVEEVRTFPDAVEEVARRAARRCGAIALRDSALLEWRFVHRPGRRYRIALARAGGRLVGYAVLRCGAFDGGDDSELLVCDWLVRPEDEGTRSSLLAWLAACAGEQGASRVTAVLPDTSEDWRSLQAAGFRAFKTPWSLAVRSRSRSHGVRWLYHNWYYTLADTDLC